VLNQVVGGSAKSAVSHHLTSDSTGHKQLAVLVPRKLWQAVFSPLIRAVCIFRSFEYLSWKVKKP